MSVDPGAVAVLRAMFPSPDVGDIRLSPTWESAVSAYTRKGHSRPVDLELVATCAQTMAIQRGAEVYPR